MPAIAVVTDTDSSLSADIAARHHIALVPIGIQFGTLTLDSGTEIDDAQLFARIRHDGKLPTTSAPAAGAFATAFSAAFGAGAEAVICYCVSSKVSASFMAARSARELMPERDITVIDSNSLSMGQGFMALAAAEAIASGSSAGDAIRYSMDVGGRAHLFAALSTLKYLAMSGRISMVAAGMATLLDVKPVLTIRDGKLDLLERVRTQTRAWSRVVELALEASKGNRIERAALVHADAVFKVQQFRQQLCASLDCPTDMLVAEFTPGLSVHAGAGAVGVVVVTGSTLPHT